MFGYRQIFEHKFRDGAAATDYANGAHWHYLRPIGLTRRSHLYEGCTVASKGDGQREIKEMRLVTASDGHTSLFIKKSSGVLGTSGLPHNVWPSLDVHDHIQRLVVEINANAEETGFALQCWGNRDYRVIEIATEENRGQFSDPTQASRWIKSQRGQQK